METTKKEKSIEDIMSSLKTKLSFMQRFILKKLLIPWSRDGVGLREQGKDLLTYALNVYRQAFWQMARLLVKEGRIPDADLMFFMKLPELEKLLEERDPNMIVRAKLRKRYHDKKDKLKFNETVIGPNMKPRDVNLIFLLFIFLDL